MIFSSKQEVAEFLKKNFKGRYRLDLNENLTGKISVPLFSSKEKGLLEATIVRGELMADTVTIA